jgi:hypothetical protein
VHAQARVTRVTREQAVASAVTPTVPTVAASGHCHASSFTMPGGSVLRLSDWLVAAADNALAQAGWFLTRVRLAA